MRVGVCDSDMMVFGRRTVIYNCLSILKFV